MGSKWHRVSLAAVVLTLLTARVCGDLGGYVKRQDKAFAWQKLSEVKKPQGTIYDLHLVSQKWQGMTWEHRLQVFEPIKIEFPGAAVLLITGGGGSDSDQTLGLTVANQTGTLCAVLYHIPNQPLFGGKNEDELIAYTFDQYLETDDETWPLLLPMVKSAVRAMDALQAWAVEEKMPALKRFIVTGGSKRGWTTWLTAATGDPRVKGIIPMVYDNLNLSAQMPNQLAAWGKYSEQIEEYTRRGLQQKMGTKKGQQLSVLVDPFAYRKSLTLPKLIVNGTNDPYWALDALNLYWDQLGGPKYVLYGVNSGHGLEQSLPAVLASATAFVRAVAADKPWPKLQWRYEIASPGVELRINAGTGARSARVWTAHSETRDFRKSRWTSAPMERQANEFVGKALPPTSGFTAVFGEVSMEQDGRVFPLSTQTRIVGSEAGPRAQPSDSSRL
jgi:PhoPQ-activated pathogenicity-related protein